MTRVVSIFLIAAVVPLLAGGAYFASSMLLSDETIVLAGADEHVERARRLLQQYGASQERLAELLDQLARAGVDVALQDERVEQLLEEDRSILEEAEETLRSQSRGPVVSRRRELAERYSAAGGDVEAPLSAPRGFGTSLSQMQRSIVEGVKVRDAILARNEKLLHDALSEINEAVAVTKGSVTGDSHPHANRLKGVILMTQAGVAKRNANSLRSLAEMPRQRVVELASRVNRLAIKQRLVEASKIRDHLEVLHEDADRAARIVTDLKAQIEILNAIIADLKERIAGFRQRAGLERASMEHLEDVGANLLDSDGFETFAAEYAKSAIEYRTAVAQAHKLEFGTLEHARIDDSGDYLYGKFVPDQPGGHIVEKRGLVDFQHDRETATLDVERNAETLKAIEANIAEFEARLKQYAQSVSAAKTESDELRSDAAETFGVFLQRVHDADAAVEEVLKKAQGAIQALRSAATLASSRARNAADRIAGAGPARQDRSPFKLRSEDRWLAGQARNELAQAYYLLGTILYQRYAAAEEDSLVASIAQDDLLIAEADPHEIVLRADTARERGVEAVRKAVIEFEKSSRELGTNWTVAAQVGGAHYLLSLLEDPVYVESAIANYEAALQGRENESATRSIAERLKQLRRR